jgi:type I restriction enzyme S subunit
MSGENRKLPDGWTRVSLGDVTTVVRGVTYKKDQKSDEPVADYIPLLRSGNIRDSLETEAELVYVPSELASDAQMLREGDIVVSTSNSRELVGKSAQLRRPWQGTFGAFCSVVRSLPSVDARFVGLFLKSPAYRNAIASASAATNNIANIRMGHLQELQMPLPPRREQEWIVAAIEEHLPNVASGVASFRTALDGVAKYRAACLAARFRTASDARRLDELSEVQSGIAKGRPGKGNLIERPYIRTANVQAGYLDLAVIKTLAVTPAQAERHRLQHEDVLILEGGDADKVGRGWLWESQIGECLHQNHVFAVRTDKETLLPRYLAHFINAPQARAYFLGCAKQTTNLASINKRQLRALPVPLMSPSDQAQAVAQLDEQLAASEVYEATLRSQVEQAEVLQSALLHHALLGRLTPRDSAAEPVAEMLERLHEERAAAEAEANVQTRKARTVPAGR